MGLQGGRGDGFKSTGLNGFMGREGGLTGLHGERGRVAETQTYLGMESIAKTLTQTRNVLPTKISVFNINIL